MVAPDPDISTIGINPIGHVIGRYLVPLSSYISVPLLQPTKKSLIMFQQMRERAVLFQIRILTLGHMASGCYF